MSMSMYLEEIKSRAEKQVEVYNLALIKNDAAKMNAAESALKEIEGEYATQAMREAFAECKKSDDPVIAAIKMYTYDVLGHTIARRDGVIEGISLTMKSKQIELPKLFKSLEKSHLWEYDLEKLGCLLCMRTAKELGIPDAEVRRIDRMYYQSEFARKSELGAVPTSNNQIVKLLQGIIDQVLPNKGYKALVVDVKYFLMCYTRRGKSKLTVSVAKFSFIQTLFMDILHRIVCDLKYDVEYKMIPRKDTAVAEEPKQVEAAPQEPETEEESESAEE